MQLQQEQAMKESLKDHLLKQASQETGVNISDLRTPSNAETQNIRINNMLRPAQFTEESFNTFHQGSKPTQFKEESFNTFHQGSKPTQFKEESFNTFHQGSNPTQVFNISGGVNTSAATADYTLRVERHELAAQEEKLQIEQRYEQMAEGIRQEAFATLNQQEQAHAQQQEQDRAYAEAAFNQVHREAQGVINETRGAANRERQERMRMEAEEKKINKQMQK